MAGDWANDGHGMTQSIIIKSNFTKDQIKEAYKSGTEIIGFDLKSDCCRKYEDDLLTTEQVNKLKSYGIIVEFECEWDGADLSEGFHVIPDEYTEIFLKICRLGDPDFNYEILDTPEVHIGGYGIFYS